MNKIVKLFAIGAGSLLIFFTVLAIYEQYTTSGWSPEIISALATLCLVLLTGWYAYSTNKLMHINQKQTEAAKASFMPALDVKYEENNNNDIVLKIRNRGEGVARNVSVLLSVVGRGIDTAQFDLSESLPPEYEYTMNESEGITVTPEYYTEFSELSLDDVFENPDEVEYSDQLITKKLVEDGPVTNLEEESDRLGSELDLNSPFPADTGSLYDVIEKHSEGREKSYIPAVYLQISFNDVLYGQRHVETVIEGGYMDPEDPTLNDIFPGNHLVSTRFSREKKPFIDVYGPIIRSSRPFRKSVDVGIQKRDPHR